MPIRILPPEVANRIAAGEVVERPASAVKELVENSLDAGADEIRVEVREGGRRLIRVMDNGEGVPTAEVPLAFERHATSKLTSAADLERIRTLGFRGEALASIASVAQVTLLTRHVAEAVGTQIRVEGGRVVDQEPKGAPPGTIVTVEHLFYNVPARLEFLRQPATETGHIASAVRNFALAFPERRFSLVSEGRLVFQSTGSGRLEDVLVKVLGVEAAQQMVPVGHGAMDEELHAKPELSSTPNLPKPTPQSSGEGEVERVWGYTSLPTLSRANRSHIVLFLNRRLIQDRSLTYAVTEAYRTRLMAGRYPLAVLLIEMDPGQVDVNVHPTKAEVRFRNERAVFRAVQKAVIAALNQHAPVPEVRPEGLGWSVPGWSERRRALTGAGQERQTSLNLEPPRRYPPEDPASTPETWDRLPGDNASRAGAIAGDPAVEVTTPQGQGARAFSPSVDHASTERGPGPTAADGVLPMLRVVGQMGATYIIAEGPQGMYLIDQHAAHERILYERMMAERSSQQVTRQALLEPVTFEPGTSYVGLLTEYAEDLENSGFDLERFGGDTWLVRTVPAIFGRRDPRQALTEVLEGIADGRDLTGETREAALVALICKRAAMKGGQVLSLDEMRSLVRQLEACRSPGSCPHGRPTMLVLSTDQLAREFGRRGALT